jgi:hypothetical protein
MQTNNPINYFSELTDPVDRVLHKIKGNFRRHFVGNALLEDGIDSVPPAWLTHDVSETLKGFLQSQHPQARGGEDLPDLEEGETEIARLTLANSVHREASSLRALAGKNKGSISLKIVDEYASEIELPFDQVDAPPTAEEVVDLFLDCDPMQVGDGNLKYCFQSYFYDDLNSIAEQRGLEISELSW